MKSTVTLTTEMSFKIPNLPNYIQCVNSEQSLPVSSISEDGLRKIGAAWTEALIAHAKMREKSHD